MKVTSPSIRNEKETSSKTLVTTESQSEINFMAARGCENSDESYSRI